MNHEQHIMNHVTKKYQLILFYNVHPMLILPYNVYFKMQYI